MADRRYSWELEIDTSKGAESLQRFQSLARSLFGNLKIELFDPNSLNTSTNAARAAAAQIIEAEKRVTIEARTSGQERAAAARTASQTAIQQARTAATTQIEQERRVTSQLRAEYAERQRAQAASSSAGGGLQNALLGGIAGYLSVQGAQQIFQYAKGIAELDTTVSRASKAFVAMAGSTGEAEKRLKAIVSASGGTVDNLTAINIANQATALGLAKTSGEFENLTRAARAVTFVSPVIHDVQSAITELALASANLSYRRLDQLGLSVTEVRTRVQDLMAANRGLDESQAFLQASVDALNSKFGTLLDSTEAQASGVEKLSASWANFTQGLANSKVGEITNAIFSDISKQIDRVNALMTGDNSAFGNIGSLNSLIGDINRKGSGSILAESLPDLEKLKAIFEEVNQLSAAGVPGIDSFAERVAMLTANVVETGYVTNEAAAEIAQFQSVVAGAASVLDESSQAGKYYADAVRIAGEETVNTDEKTSALVSQMVNLNAQQASGVISAADYATQIAIVGSQLVTVAGQAANAAGALAAVNYQTSVFYAAANSKLYFGSGGTQGTRPIGPMTVQQAQQTGQYYGPPIAQPWEPGGWEVDPWEKRRIEYREQVAKEQEKADKEAAAAAKKAASAGTRLYNQAQQELQSSIASIVKLSQVTQQDIEDAKNGIYKEKPDEYLRRLRDEVKNGKNYDDVSIEAAAAGLNKIGVETAGKSSEAILQLFEQAFSDMSLFADKDNLKFLNDAAVEQQLKLKELAKQGQQNVFEHYGVVVGQAVQAALGGGGGGGATASDGESGGAAAPAAINVDGKGIAGNGINIAATVTKLEIAEGAMKEIAPKLTFSLQSVVFTADDAALVLQRIEGQIGSPKLTFNAQSIVFTADDAQLARDRLSSQLTPTLDLGAPGKGFYLGTEAAEKIKQGLADAITPTLPVLLDATQQEQELLSTKISQNVVPVITPMLGEPDMKEITSLQQRITSLLNSDEAANPTVESGGLGGVLNKNAKSKANPLATRYVADIVASFSNVEVTLPLLGVGSFVLGVIDQGFELAKAQSTIGTDIIMGINAQVFTEQNVALQKSIGNNIYQLILAGIRVAMQAKNNNVGQEIVDNIAAQVVEATVGAVEGAVQ